MGLIAIIPYNLFFNIGGGMRTIVAGGRNVTDYRVVLNAMDIIGWTPTVIISGNANGVDKLGERWAKENVVVTEIFPANWDKYGKSAGYIRNDLMAKEAEALLLIWDGKSKGSGHMLKSAIKHKLKIMVYIV